MHQYQSPWMDEDLRIFRDAVRGFMRREFEPQVDAWREAGRVDRSSWLKAGAMGLLCTDVPEAHGGGGGTFAHEAVVYEEFARINDTSFCKGIHECCAHYVLEYGSEEQKRAWLPAMARGEMIGAIAMTEPGGGSDLQAVRTTAVRDGDHYVLNGSKTFISNGAICDLVLVVAKTDASKGAKGISLIAVETAGLEGFRRGRVLDKIGQKGQDTSELFFDDVRVPASCLLGGEEGQGFAQLMNQLPYERTIVALQAVAFMERAVEVTVDYVKDRRAFGQRVADFQNTRFKLAECRTEAVIGRVFIDHCIARLIDGTLDATTASMAKLWTTEQQFRIADECLQLHGGYGYMDEYPIARMFVDARVQRIYAGTNEIMKEIIARSL